MKLVYSEFSTLIGSFRASSPRSWEELRLDPRSVCPLVSVQQAENISLVLVWIGKSDEPRDEK
jgi:hypothetical protein